MYVVFKDRTLSQGLRIRLYVACIISILRYCCEAWTFDVKAQRKVNGFNAHCMAVIRGREFEEMARDPPYDLVGEIRRQRLTFTGHVLRYGEERLTRRVLLAYFSRFRGPLEYPEGSILEDAPKHRNLEELIVLANDRERWREEVGRIEGKRHSLELKASSRKLERVGETREEATATVTTRVAHTII